MSDTFETTCRHCQTDVSVTVPAKRTLKPFSCPGCGQPLVIDAAMAPTPVPGVDTSPSPATQATITHFERNFS